MVTTQIKTKRTEGQNRLFVKQNSFLNENAIKTFESQFIFIESQVMEDMKTGYRRKTDK